MPRVLVIDDDSAVQEVLASFCARLGLEHDGAPDGIAAVQLAQRRRPDLVIMDFQLPAGDGALVMERLERLLGDIPVVFISGQEPGKVAGLLALGPRRLYLRKPLHLGQLENAVRSLLGPP